MDHENDNGSEFRFTEAELEVGSLFYGLIARVATEMFGFTLTLGTGKVHASSSALRCILLIADNMRQSGLVVPECVTAELNRLANEAEQKAMARVAPHRVTVRVPNNGRVQ